ncbi:MAG: permease-like cell division protein FtsX [Lachnospiraceae bacterium]|nr:permease-like cell division protein FtsX [Lachnospiraceae bacterium]
MDSFFYCFGEGIKNIRRNRLFSIASIATMTVCIFLFGIMYFMLVNVRYNLLELENGVGATVFFREGITEQELVDLKNKIVALDGVRRIEYISADEAWTKFKEDHFSDSDSDMLKSFGDDNPLANSASFEVYFHSAEDQLTAIEAIRGMEADGVRYVNNAEDLVRTLTSLNRGFSAAAIILIVLLLAIALFLISTTVSIGVSVRAREIQIQSLIGATDLFIRGPFLVEGILIGLLGAAIPISILYGLYYKMVQLVSTKLGILGAVNFVDVNEVFAVLAPLSVCIGVGIGFFGSYITLNKELRKFRKM